MAIKYKDFMIRWACTATWTFHEAALLLNNHDPLTKTFSPDKKGSDRESVLYFWLVKQQRQGYLATIDDEEPLRSSPGDIIRLIRAHHMAHSKDMAALWEVFRYRKNTDRILSTISWDIYLQAIKIILKKYPAATKTQIAHSLELLPDYCRFPDNSRLARFSFETLLRKMRNIIVGAKSGRPTNASHVEIDMALVSSEIRIK